MYEGLKAQIKNHITDLVNNEKFIEAYTLIDEYLKVEQDDVEAYSIKAVILIMQEELNKAQNVIKKGLDIDENNFDLNYNLAYLYEKLNDKENAIRQYGKTLNICNNENIKAEILKTMNNIEEEYKKQDELRKIRIAFFVKQGMDSFLENIINGLSNKYETKKIIVTQYNQIDEGMEWADICWFEWCDELIAYGSNHRLAINKKIICRLHSYEAFTNYPNNVDWYNVDSIVFIAEHIRNHTIEKFNIDKDKTKVIPNGIDLLKYRFKKRKPGYNIAYVGYINYKKGPMLLLHTFKAIYDKDKRYKLYIAGEFQDDRDYLYFNQMIKEFGIEKNVFYEGWQDNLDKWLENKNYILCTSILESQNMSVMQAMAKGIKPLIHNFVGARNIYNENYIWNTIDEAISILEDKNYDSKKYYKFIKDKFSFEREIDTLDKLLESINNNKDKYTDSLKEKPLVTIGIINYNGKQYLERCIESYLNQTYSNIEILLIDDCSTDGSKEMIQEYEKKYENIKGIYHEVNSGGASRGIQDIIENCRGKYFQWIACDDFVEKNTVEMFVDYLEKRKDKDYVYSNFNIVDENGIKTGEWNYQVLDHKQVIQHIFYNASGIIPMNCMYRLEFFKKNNINWIIYKGNDFSCDTINSLHFIKYKWNYGKIDKGLINYRIHSNNLSHDLEKRTKTSVSVFDYIIKNFKEEIYFPQIDWNNTENRLQLKNYLIANFYYEQIVKHVNIKQTLAYSKSNISKEELMQHCSVFIEEGMAYINEALKMGNKYKVKINELKDKFYQYIKYI